MAGKLDQTSVGITSFRRFYMWVKVKSSFCADKSVMETHAEVRVNRYVSDHFIWTHVELRGEYTVRAIRAMKQHSLLVSTSLYSCTKY